MRDASGIWARFGVLQIRSLAGGPRSNGACFSRESCAEPARSLLRAATGQIFCEQ